MNDFPARLTAMLDDVATGIEPAPNFEAVRAAGVPVVAAGVPVIGRVQRPLLGVAAASVLIAGGLAAYRVIDRGGVDSAASGRSSQFEFDARPPTWPQDPMPPAPVVVIPALDAADGGEADSTTTSIAVEDKDTGDRSDSATVPAAAELGQLAASGARLTQNISGTAPDGTVVTAVAAGSPPTVAIASDGVWKLSLDLSGAERGTKIVIEVTIGDAEPIVFEITTPDPAPQDADAASKEAQAETIATIAPKPSSTVAPGPKPEEKQVEPTPVPKPVPKSDPAPKPEPKVEPEPEPKVEPEPEPKVEPKPDPAPVPFTVNLVDPYQDATWIKQSFYGTAPIGARVVASSDWGSVDTVANEKGKWELRLILTGVPDGTVVPVVVSDGAGGSGRYELIRKMPEPVVKEFTSSLGDVYDNADYFKPVLTGTGEAGSVVVAASEWGRAETTVNTAGYWEIWFKMFEVPNGPVGVWVSNSASSAVFEYDLERRNAWEPETVEFSVSAACSECATFPPSNAYWGAAAPGSVVSVSSPFGGGQVVVGESGGWEIGVEFPEAPIGEKFWVQITNSVSAKVFDKPMTVLETF